MTWKWLCGSLHCEREGGAWLIAGFNAFIHRAQSIVLAHTKDILSPVHTCWWSLYMWVWSIRLGLTPKETIVYCVYMPEKGVLYKSHSKTQYFMRSKPSLCSVSGLVTLAFHWSLYVTFLPRVLVWPSLHAKQRGSTGITSLFSHIRDKKNAGLWPPFGPVRWDKRRTFVSHLLGYESEEIWVFMDNLCS